MECNFDFDCAKHARYMLSQEKHRLQSEQVIKTNTMRESEQQRTNKAMGVAASSIMGESTKMGAIASGVGHQSSDMKELPEAEMKQHKNTSQSDYGSFAHMFVLLSIAVFLLGCVQLYFSSPGRKKGLVFVRTIGNDARLRSQFEDIREELEFQYRLETYILSQDITQTNALMKSWESFSNKIGYMKFVLVVSEGVFEDDRANSLNTIFLELYKIKGLEVLYDYIYLLVIPKDNSKITRQTITGCLRKYLQYLISPANGKTTTKLSVLRKVIINLLIKQSFTVADVIGLPRLISSDFLPSLYACSFQLNHSSATSKLQSKILSDLQYSMGNQTYAFNENHLFELFHYLQEVEVDKIREILLEYLPVNREEISIVLRNALANEQGDLLMGFVNRLKNMTLQKAISQEIQRWAEGITKTKDHKENQRNRQRFIEGALKRLKAKIGECGQKTKFDIEKCKKEELVVSLINQQKSLWEKIYDEHITEPKQQPETGSEL